jgi:hypothetical protein
VCDNLEEFDEATNAISFANYGSVRLTTSTMVVARGVDLVPTYRDTHIRKVISRPEVDDLERLAGELIKSDNKYMPVSYDSDYMVKKFNNLDSSRKLHVLYSMNEFSKEMNVHGMVEYKKN